VISTGVVSWPVIDLLLRGRIWVVGYGSCCSGEPNLKPIGEWRPPCLADQWNNVSKRQRQTKLDHNSILGAYMVEDILLSKI